MNRGHWTEQELIDHIYGIGPADNHLGVCQECQARHREFLARKQAATREPEIPHEFFAAQRRAIHQRLEHKPSRLPRTAPAFAAVLLLLMGLFFMRQSPAPAPPPANTASDNQIFADIYALEQSSEPRAVAPVRALFEEN